VELDSVARTAFDPEDEYRPEPVPEPLPPAWLEGGLRIGIHTSIAGSHVNALESAAKLGCSALQIFSVNPRMWAGGAIAARITEAEAKAFRDRLDSVVSRGVGTGNRAGGGFYCGASGELHGFAAGVGGARSD
jgi:hypothetical protein